MKHSHIISSCLLLTVIAASLLAPQTRAQAISDEETVQLLRKIANLNVFLNDPKAFPEDKIGSETYKDAVRYILFDASRRQEFKIDGDLVKYEQWLTPSRHYDTSTSEVEGFDARGKRVKITTTTTQSWVDSEGITDANNCMAHYSLYYLYDRANPYALESTCRELPKTSILYNWLFMMCRYHLDETMVFDGKDFFHTEKTPEELEDLFVKMHQGADYKKIAYDSIDDKVLDILDYHRLDLNSEIRVFHSAWLNFHGVKTDTIEVCLCKGELQKDDFDLSGKSDDEIAETAYYVNAYPFAIALAYKKNIHIIKRLRDNSVDESVNVTVPYSKIVDLVRNCYSPSAFKKTLAKNPFYIAP